MQVHVVIALNGEPSIEALNSNVQRVYGDRQYRLTGKPAWLVADDALARTVCEKLGIDGPQGIAALVTTIGNYFGRANPEIWAWIKTMYERPAPPSQAESASNAASATGSASELAAVA